MYRLLSFALLFSLLASFLSVPAAGAFVDLEFEQHILYFDDRHEDDLRRMMSSLDRDEALKYLKLLRVISPELSSDFLDVIDDADLHPMLLESLARASEKRGVERTYYLEDVVDSAEYWQMANNSLRKVIFTSKQYDDATYNLLESIVTADRELANKQRYFMLFDRIVSVLLMGDVYRAGLRINSLLRRLQY